MKPKPGAIVQQASDWMQPIRPLCFWKQNWRDTPHSCCGNMSQCGPVDPWVEPGLQTSGFAAVILVAIILKTSQWCHTVIWSREKMQCQRFQRFQTCLLILHETIRNGSLAWLYSKCQIKVHPAVAKKLNSQWPRGAAGFKPRGASIRNDALRFGHSVAARYADTLQKPGTKWRSPLNSGLWLKIENSGLIWFDVSHPVDHHFPSFSIMFPFAGQICQITSNFPSISVSNKFPDIGWESGGLCHPTLCAGWRYQVDCFTTWARSEKELLRFVTIN